MLECVDHDLGAGRHTMADRQGTTSIQERIVSNVAVIANVDSTRMEEKCLPVDDASLSYVHAKKMTIHVATKQVRGHVPNQVNSE
jgi:hypothetical protein